MTQTNKFSLNIPPVKFNASFVFDQCAVASKPHFWINGDGQCFLFFFSFFHVVPPVACRQSCHGWFAARGSMSGCLGCGHGCIICVLGTHGCIICVLGTWYKSQAGEDEKPLIGVDTGNLETAAARELSMLMCDGSLDTASWSALSSGTGKRSGKLFIVLVLLHISLILSAVWLLMNVLSYVKCYATDFAICHISKCNYSYAEACRKVSIYDCRLYLWNMIFYWSILSRESKSFAK